MLARRVDRIGQVARLRALDQPNEARRMHVPALVVAVRPATALSPEVALVHVVVVGDHDARRRPREVAVGPAPQVPLVEVVELEVRAVGGRRAAALVDLVAGEEEQVGLSLGCERRQVGVREPHPVAPVERLPRDRNRHQYRRTGDRRALRKCLTFPQG